MAMTSIGYSMTVVLKDLGDNTSTLKYKFGSNVATFADALTAKGNLLTNLGAVTDAAIVAVNVMENFEDSAATGAGEISTQAVISARMDTTPIKYATVKIPAPVAGVFVEASGPLYNEVDPADADLVTLLSMYESTGPFTLSDGERLADAGTPANIKGWRAHRASRG